MRRQCALVGVARSGVYRPKPVAEADDLAVMRRIDELHLELPFYGSRRMTFELNKEGRVVNRKRVQRLMRVMGIEALVPRPGTSKAVPGHKIYPYQAARPEDCRAEPRVGGRRDLHPDGVRFPLLIWWRSSTGPAGRFWHGGCRTPTMRASCAAARWRRRCFGSESCGFSPTRAPLSPPRLSPASFRTAGVVISMDGRGRFMDNIFIERLWRSIKYEEVHLKAYADGCEARSGTDELLQFSAPSSGDEQPDADGGVARRHGQNRGGGRAVDMPLRLTTQTRCPHTHSRSSKKRLDLEHNGRRDDGIQRPLVLRMGSQFQR